MPEEVATTSVEDCAGCGKPAALCVCDGITPIDNKIGVLVLRHPQEQDKTLGTAQLTVLHLRNGLLKTGLSWPSLSAALGRPAEPRNWAVLYLGSSNAAELLPGNDLVFLDRKGAALPEQATIRKSIEGIIALDGTWSQAKALWWRNAWMLKCRRVILDPREPSRYGKLRREPRRDGLSTIESVALLLSRIEGRPEIESELQAGFIRMLDRYKKANPHRPRVDRRRRR